MKHAFPSRLDAMLDHQISRGPRPSAREHVDRALRACLPPGVPPAYVSIDGARYVSSQPRHEAEAELTMFDGRPAKVRVWFWDRRGHAYAHEWIDTGSQPCSFEGGRWVRIDPVSLEPVRDQGELPSSPSPARIGGGR